MLDLENEIIIFVVKFDLGSSHNLILNLFNFIGFSFQLVFFPHFSYTSMSVFAIHNVLLMNIRKVTC